MPSSFNKYDIDDQFTNKAWKDMQGRLDKALPIKKPFITSKWVGLATMLCLLGFGLSWLASYKNTHSLNKNTIEIDAYIENNLIANKSILSPTTLFNDKMMPKFEETKDTKNEISRVKKSSTKENKNFQNIEISKSDNELKNTTEKNAQEMVGEFEETIASKTKKITAINIDRTIRNDFLHPFESTKKRQKLYNIAQQIPLPAISSTLINKLQTINHFLLPNNLISDKLSSNSDEKTKYNASVNLGTVKKLVPISISLKETVYIVEKPTFYNQSSAVFLKDEKLNVLHSDFQMLNFKAIHYGIKQGLSSDLSSESAIFVGPFVHFKLSKSWFAEFAPAYQFRAFNQKKEIQFDVLVSANVSPEDDLIIDENTEGGEGVVPSNNPTPIETSPPAEIEVVTALPTYVKDTVFTTLQTNRHYIAADFLLGYQILPKIEALLGISVARNFNDSSKTIQILNSVSKNPKSYPILKSSLYNTWRFAPKVTFRFALKPQLSLETFYAHHLIPLIKKEYQLDKTNFSSNNSNSYLSGIYGLNFVYTFK